MCGFLCGEKGAVKVRDSCGRDVGFLEASGKRREVAQMCCDGRDGMQEGIMLLQDEVCRDGMLFAHLVKIAGRTCKKKGLGFTCGGFTPSQHGCVQTLPVPCNQPEKSQSQPEQQRSQAPRSPERGAPRILCQ
eukprot:361172-Chlamydomonas_euryale.AAC.3